MTNADLIGLTTGIGILVGAFVWLLRVYRDPKRHVWLTPEDDQLPGSRPMAAPHRLDDAQDRLGLHWPRNGGGNLYASALAYRRVRAAWLAQAIQSRRISS